MLSTIFFSIYFFDTYTRMQYIVSLFYLMCLFFKEKKIYIPSKFLFIYLILNIISIFKLLSNGYTLDKMIQQNIIVIPIVVSYYNLFFNYSLKKLWKNYMKISYLFSLLGLIQEIIYFFSKINILIKPFNLWAIHLTYPLDNGLLQISSLSGEPGMYAQVLTPAVIYILENIEKEKKINLRKGVILISYLLTFTAIAYFNLIIYFILKVVILILQKRWKEIIKVILVGGSLIIVIFIKLGTEILKLKILETFNSLINISKVDYTSVNLSTFALISNLKVGILAKQYLLGNGYGSIEQVYYRFFNLKNYIFYGQNATDGYSLFIRIFIEFGLVGVLVSLIFLYNYSILKNKTSYFKMINLGVVVGIISYLIRGGSYHMQGIIIFALFLVFSYKRERSIF